MKIAQTTGSAVDQTGLTAAAQAGGLPTHLGLVVVIGKIISYLLGVMGIIVFILIIISGFQWMTSGGDAQKITAARGRLLNAIIGLAIILAAYSVTWFILKQITTATGAT